MQAMLKRCFTLVEIMIVVAIITLLAAIGIPGLLRSRLTGNEATAIRGVKSIATACEVYRAAQISPIYPATLNNLTNVSPPYISSLGPGDPVTKAGYTYTLTGTENSFYVIANPTQPGSTGIRSFCVNETGNLYSQTSSMAGGCSGSVLN